MDVRRAADSAEGRRCTCRKVHRRSSSCETRAFVPGWRTEQMHAMHPGHDAIEQPRHEDARSTCSKIEVQRQAYRCLRPIEMDHRCVKQLCFVEPDSSIPSNGTMVPTLKQEGRLVSCHSHIPRLGIRTSSEDRAIASAASPLAPSHGLQDGGKQSYALGSSRRKPRGIITRAWSPFASPSTTSHHFLTFSHCSSHLFLELLWLVSKVDGCVQVGWRLVVG